MCPVDKKVCLRILDRAISVSHDPVHFSGQAKQFEKFKDPNFQKFASEHGILLTTKIKAWKRGSDTFDIEIQQ